MRTPPITKAMLGALALIRDFEKLKCPMRSSVINGNTCWALRRRKLIWLSASSCCPRLRLTKAGRRALSTPGSEGGR